ASRASTSFPSAAYARATASLVVGTLMMASAFLKDSRAPAVSPLSRCFLPCSKRVRADAFSPADWAALGEETARARATAAQLKGLASARVLKPRFIVMAAWFGGGGWFRRSGLRRRRSWRARHIGGHGSSRRRWKGRRGRCGRCRRGGGQ